ncbi:unnamed protein product [Malus baccata var. baccata]
MGTFVQNSAQEDEHIFRKFVLQNAELYAGNVAFVEAVTGKEITYSEVYAIVALGIMAAGGVFSGANPSGHASEIKKQVEVAGAKIIVTNGATYEKQQTVPETELMSSCSRLIYVPSPSHQAHGLSKGVMLTHRNLVANLSSTLFGVMPNMIAIMTAAAPLAREVLNAFENNSVFVLINYIGYIDDDDNVFIIERIKELIKYKGFQVAPAELEAILLCHPSVEDVAVVLEIPTTSVVIAAGAKESEEEIINYVASNVAQYKKVSSALCGHSTKITLREGHEKACQREHDRKIKASKLHCLN